MKKLLRFSLPIAGAYGAGLAGSLFLNAGADSWYAGLAKPPLTPPDAVFPAVWIVLYACMGVACVIVWLRDSQSDHHAAWVRFYFLHLLPNAGWTIFFFGFHSIFLALLDVFVLLFAALALAATAYRIDRRAGFLFMPYLAWVSFAAYLTAGIFALN